MSIGNSEYQRQHSNIHMRLQYKGKSEIPNQSLELLGKFSIPIFMYQVCLLGVVEEVAGTCMLALTRAFSFLHT